MFRSTWTILILSVLCSLATPRRALHRPPVAFPVEGGTIMPCNAIDLDYQRKWMARRRAEYFCGKRCAHCGATEGLQLDHIDPSTKVHHTVWSWRSSRREEELKKCQPLCATCHKRKTAQERVAAQSGVPIAALRRITDGQVAEARKLREGGITVRAAASLFGISHNRLAELTSRPESITRW